MERFAVSRLVGAPPGYVGYDEGGQLTEAVRRNPYSVVLLDEIEKAHPDVFNILLQIMEDGRLTDSQGRQVDFKNVVLIMTSNVGANEIVEGRSVGFRGTAEMNADDDKRYDSMKNRVMEELKRTFRPEFLNRVDEIIVFHQLTRDEIHKIVDLNVSRVQKQLAAHGMKLEISDRTRELIATEGYDPHFGARPIRRAVQRLIEDPLSEEVLLGRFGEGDTIVADVDDDNHVHFVRGGEEPKEPVAAAAPPKSRTKKAEPEPPADDDGGASEG
jgi:ATP-dependent Clp protease ATP-binding subunit ClpC